MHVIYLSRFSWGEGYSQLYINFSVTEIIYFGKNTCQNLWITSTFEGRHRSWAAATPVKYEYDIPKVTSVLVMVTMSENKVMEEIVLVTPPKDYFHGTGTIVPES